MLLPPFEFVRLRVQCDALPWLRQTSPSYAPAFHCFAAAIARLLMAMPLRHGALQHLRQSSHLSALPSPIISGLSYAAALRCQAYQRHCPSTLCLRWSGLCTSMASPSKSLPLLCLTILLSAFVKLNKTILRSSFADLCSSFADRCTTLPVNAMPMQIRSTLFPRDSRPCHASAKLCVALAVLRYAIAVQSHAAAVHSLATAMQILAFADQILSLPPLCAAMPIEA